MHCMQDFCTIAPTPAYVANAYRHILQDNKAVLVLKGFPLDQPWPNYALTVFTSISIHTHTV